MDDSSLFTTIIKAESYLKGFSNSTFNCAAFIAMSWVNSAVEAVYKACMLYKDRSWNTNKQLL